MTNRLTLSEQFFRDQANAKASGGLSTVLNRFSLAARMLASEIMRAGFIGKLGYTGTTNVQDENVRALDVISNDVIIQVFENIPMVSGIASEEMEDVHLLPGGESGKYVITCDPLDGSGNVDVAGQMGTIFGVYRGDELIESFRLSTDTERTADEHGALLLPLFTMRGVDPASAEAVVISSVVPPLHLTLERLAQRYFGKRPLFIEPGVRTGMPIRYDNPTEVGADRIVNAVAARERYGAPVIVVDFGTATTFDVVNAAGEYAGGIIAPGITISAEALFAHASRLYRVDVRKPAELVGSNTAAAMQAGIYYGYIGLVDGILPSHTYEVVIDRAEAIRRAVTMAEPDDVIVIAGKGHETYQIFKDRTIPFDDRAVARSLIEARVGKGGSS